MKKIFLGLVASVFFLPNVSAQTNNPMNQFGSDVVAAAKVIYQDYRNGKLNNIDQQQLDQYSKTLLPEHPSISLEDFNLVLSTLKNANNTSIIENSKYSEEGKGFLKKSLESYSITKLVDEVQKSKIDKSEKENILRVLAINYNLIKPYLVGKTEPATKGCVEVSDGFELAPTIADEGINGVIWGGIGYIFGSAICPLCGAVGGLVGLVTGGWMDEKGIKPTISSGNHFGSGSFGSGGWSPQP